MAASAQVLVRRAEAEDVEWVSSLASAVRVRAWSVCSLHTGGDYDAPQPSAWPSRVY